MFVLLLTGIQAGARSGLSTIVCGTLFLLSTLMSSFWAGIPDTGIATVLLVVGFLFFDSTASVDWKNTKEALPTFTTAIMTAFTCSVLNGAVIGTLMYVLLTITTDFSDNLVEVILKGFFRGWNWARDCMYTADDVDDIRLTSHSDEKCDDHKAFQKGEAVASVSRTVSCHSDGVATRHDSYHGKTYYQSSS